MKTLEVGQPDWDMTPFFSELGAEDYVVYKREVLKEVERRRTTLEALGPLGAETRAAWAEALCALEELQRRFGHLRTYLGCLSAADSGDEAIQRETASLGPARAELQKALVAVRAAFKAASDAEFEALLADARLDGAQYALTRMRKRARHTMAATLEGLAADLGVNGISAWGRLYGQVSGKLSFQLEVEGQEARELPVAMARTFLEDPDRAVRTAALRGSNAAWEQVGDTVAACLNAISGTRLSLYERRGIDHFLEPALLDSAISRQTLDAMLGAVRARHDVPHRYLAKKAELLGVPKLGFQDLMAPLPSDRDERLSWERARGDVSAAFAAFYPGLAELAERAFADRWIDYTPRPAKRPGGFCASSSVIGQSRVFMTFNGASGDVQTLAHELGHAFHSWVMRDMRPWARSYPMTLAETASTFAEQLTVDAALEAPSASEATRRAILDQRLLEAAVFLCNIPMRFDFEHALYTRRAAGELSLSELKQMMEDAQRKNFGGTLDPAQLDPWYWASKLHFYITEISFYNFPYTFGYLFSLGIFARAKQEGPDFLPGYEALLRRTGSADAEEVARESLGVDLTKPDFWNASIDLIEQDLDRFLAG
ncbi:MAG: M3 family oligoendopeptidase [Myxococcales bacterium]|nr:M3 family oligoendopeptidase [Myxococcales bacterium]